MFKPNTMLDVTFCNFIIKTLETIITLMKISPKNQSSQTIKEPHPLSKKIRYNFWSLHVQATNRENAESDQLTVSRDVIIRLSDVHSRVKLNIKSRIL